MGRSNQDAITKKQVRADGSLEHGGSDRYSAIQLDSTYIYIYFEGRPTEFTLWQMLISKMRSEK